MDRLIFADSIVSASALLGLMTWITGIWFFDALTFITAGILPLGMIILAEGLLRRHASKLVKMIAAATALVFIPLALLPESFAEPWRSILLLMAQLWGFLTAGYMVWTRDKDSLSSGENRIIERIILFMCWLTISLERSHLKNSDMLKAFLILLSGSVFAGMAIAYLVDTNMTGYFQICVITLSVTMVAVLYNDSIALRFDERRESLLKHMAEGNMSSSATFLRGLQNHTLVEGAVILEADDLQDFDHKLLKSVFKNDALQRKNDMNKANSSAEIEHLNWLFERF